MILVVYYFRKKALLQMFGRVLNTHQRMIRSESFFPFSRHVSVFIKSSFKVMKQDLFQMDFILSDTTPVCLYETQNELLCDKT